MVRFSDCIWLCLCAFFLFSVNILSPQRTNSSKHFVCLRETFDNHRTLIAVKVKWRLNLLFEWHTLSHFLSLSLSNRKNAFFRSNSIVHKIEWMCVNIVFNSIFVMLFCDSFFTESNWICYLSSSTTWHFPSNHSNNYPVLMLTMATVKKIDHKVWVRGRWDTMWGSMNEIVTGLSIICVGFLIITRRVVNRATGFSHSHTYPRETDGMYLYMPLFPLLKFIRYHVLAFVQSLLYRELNDIMSLHTDRSTVANSVYK